MKAIQGLDIVAIYGAALSTIVALWNYYQWLTTGPKLAVRIIKNQKFAKGFFDEAKTYIFIAIANRGNAETTITGLNFFACKNFLGQLRNKGRLKLVPIHFDPNVRLPYRLAVGHELTAYAVQDSELEEWSRKHRTFLSVSHSMADKPQMERLSPIKSEEGLNE